jgi:hypothetical protein
LDNSGYAAWYIKSVILKDSKTASLKVTSKLVDYIKGSRFGFFGDTNA